MEVAWSVVKAKQSSHVAKPWLGPGSAFPGLGLAGISLEGRGVVCVGFSCSGAKLGPVEQKDDNRPIFGKKTK